MYQAGDYSRGVLVDLFVIVDYHLVVMTAVMPPVVSANQMRGRDI